MSYPRDLDALNEAVVRTAGGEGVPPMLARQALSETLALADRGSLFAQEHPLGFIHFELTPVLARVERRRIRMHAWTQESVLRADPAGRIHDHLWMLRSSVLVGGLEDQILSAVPDPEGDYKASGVLYGTEVNALSTIDGFWTLTEVGRRHVWAGSSYQLQHGEIHLTRVLAFPTVTLAVTEEEGTDPPMVFSPRDSGAHVAAPRTRLDGAVARSSLDQALASIERA